MYLDVKAINQKNPLNRPFKKINLIYKTKKNMKSQTILILILTISTSLSSKVSAKSCDYGYISNSNGSICSGMKLFIPYTTV